MACGSPTTVACGCRLRNDKCPSSTDMPFRQPFTRLPMTYDLWACRKTEGCHASQLAIECSEVGLLIGHSGGEAEDTLSLLMLFLRTRLCLLLPVLVLVGSLAFAFFAVTEAELWLWLSGDDGDADLEWREWSVPIGGSDGERISSLRSSSSSLASAAVAVVGEGEVMITGISRLDRVAIGLEGRRRWIDGKRKDKNGGMPPKEVLPLSLVSSFASVLMERDCQPVRILAVVEVNPEGESSP